MIRFDLRRINVLAIILFLPCLLIFSQTNDGDNDPYEVFLIDAYVTPEIPYTFVLSFFTSDSLKSTLILDNSFEFPICEVPNEDHKIKLDISKMRFDSIYIPFMIKLTDNFDNEYYSQVFELALPGTYNIKIEDAPGFITTCCLGGVIFGLPSPNFVYCNDKSFFSLTKEIPILTYYSHGYNYPSYYLSLEYTYIFDLKERSAARLGIKKIFLLDMIEYVSPGISYYNDFNSGNGFAPEISIGLFKISNTFTLYAKYRYNIELNDNEDDYHEISLGLFSSFFSLNL